MSRRKQKHHAKAQSRPVAHAEPFRKNLPVEARALIANVQNDITIPYYSGLLQHADDTLIQQGGGKGLAIYAEVERDTHAGAMLEKRRNALISRELDIAPGGDRPIDKDAGDLVGRLLKALPFDLICKGLLKATLNGYAVAEIVWARVGAEIHPVQIVVHDARRFGFDRDWQPRLLTLSNMQLGEPLPERKFLIHRFGVDGNNPYGLGLGSRLFWAVLFKREGITFWLHFLEKFSAPTVVGKTPYGMLPEEQQRLLNSLMSIRTASALTAPIGTEIEFLEASRSGTVTYEQFVAYWDRQISICVTGETLTTQVGDNGGNRALGEVHQEQLDVLADSDGDLLADTLREQLCRWIVDYNMPGAALPSIWRIRPKNEQAAANTRKTKAESAKALDDAIKQIVAQAAAFEDDDVAREYIVSFDITDALSDRAIDALVEARHDFAGEDEEPDAFVTGAQAMFSARRLKKKR